MQEIILQPAALTLWIWLELDDVERIAILVRRLERFEEAGVTATAIWAGKEFQRMESAFKATLNVHPDPDMEQVRRDRAIADGVRTLHPGNLIQVASVIGGEKS